MARKPHLQRRCEPRPLETLAAAAVTATLLAVALSITVNVGGIFIVLAAGYKFIYGDKGIVTGYLLALFPGMDPGWLSGFFAVLAVMSFATTTNHMLFVTNALKGVDFQTIEAARNMGASDWTVLWRSWQSSLAWPPW